MSDGVTFVAGNYGLVMVSAQTSPDVGIDCVAANGCEFSYLQCGKGPLALCLHGFPDTAQTWRHLLPALASNGYRAVAPFMRGYGPSAIPQDGCYQTAMLARDANALHEILGGDHDAVIIGHDWGAPSAYGAALDAPTRWRKVVGMAVPPCGAVSAAFVQNLAQLKRSWYMFFFQHGLADFVVGANDHAFIDMLWKDWSAGYDATQDLAFVKKSLADPKHLQAALGYYRATLGNGYRDPSLDDLQTQMAATAPSQPLLYLHGRNDGAIGVEVAESVRAMVPTNVLIEIIDNAGHFLHLEQIDIVNQRICEFLGR